MNSNLMNHQNPFEFSESFHPIKWLENIGAFLNMNSETEKPSLCDKGKKSVQTTVLTHV